MQRVVRFIIPLCTVLFVTSLACAGGIDPREMPAEAPIKQEKVTATPAQTSAAVSKARSVVVPPTQEAPARVAPAPAPAKVGGEAWQLSSRESGCAPLTSVSRKVANIGNFSTPQEFARQMQQRGYQAFVLDIGDSRDQVIRVKVPDQNLDLTFVRAGLCR